MNSAASKNYSAQLFKADQRGSVSNEGYKCHSTFNFGNYEEESRKPFGALQFVNDVSVGAGSMVLFNRSETIQDIILPITGSFTFKHFQNKKEQLDPEYVLFLEPGSDQACEIQNHYEKEWVNYLHIGISRPPAQSHNRASTFLMNLTAKDTFAPLHIDQVIGNTYGYTGVYNGRTKDSYTVKQAGNGLFIYIINGAFEVEDRQMEYRDGLSLWNSNHVEFEALSENAILLLLEIPLDPNQAKL